MYLCKSLESHTIYSFLANQQMSLMYLLLCKLSVSHYVFARAMAEELTALAYHLLNNSLIHMFSLEQVNSKALPYHNKIIQTASI